MQCPRCGSVSVRRRARVGAFERLLSLLSVYPFRCQRCNHGFRALTSSHARHPERRDSPRVPVRLPARLTAGTDSVEGETIELSITGCALRANAPFPPGTEVRCMLDLGSSGTVAITDAVIRASHEGRVSVQFVRMDVDDQRRLGDYIDARALPVDVGGPQRRARLPIELVLAAAAGLLVIFLLLSMIARAATPLR